MERSITRQIIDTLHLILRIILGITTLSGAVGTFFSFTLYIIYAEGWASKYGSIFEDAIIWPIFIIIIGSIPSAIAGVLLIFKNRVLSRNIRETALSVVNIVSINLSIPFVSERNNLGDMSSAALAVMIALLYPISALLLIKIARGRS